MRLSAFRSIPRYDALVVGARCAGAATAMLLARQGLKVLAVDRQPEGSDTLSTHALMRPAAMLLARWGVLGELFALGTPPLRRTTFHFAAGLASGSGSGSGGERLEVPIKPGHGVDALAAPRRTQLDAAPAAQARRAGVDLRFGVSLVAAVRDARGRVTGAVLGQPDGTRAEVACDLLVGADGRASQVAAAVGAPVLRQARHSSVLLYGYHRGLGRDAYHWHYAPGASAGVIPTDDGEACVYAATSEARMRGGFGVDPRAAYRDLLAEAAPELGPRALPGGGRLRAFWGAKGFLRQAHGPGWALVGGCGPVHRPAHLPRHLGGAARRPPPREPPGRGGPRRARELPGRARRAVPRPLRGLGPRGLLRLGHGRAPRPARAAQRRHEGRGPGAGPRTLGRPPGRSRLTTWPRRPRAPWPTPHDPVRNSGPIDGDLVLSGGDGTDVLGGETGRHLLTGGADADNFVLLSRAESAASATTRDTIADFEGDLDVVDLRLIDARADAPANNAFTFIGTNVAWGGQAG